MTEIIKTNLLKAAAIKQISDSLSGGGLACLPTDTVYGLACLPTARDALDNLYTAKGRDFDKPVALVFPDLNEIFDTLISLPEKIRKALTKLMPGPVTAVVAATPAELSALNMPQTATAGLRVVSYPFSKLFKVLPGPLALTSANLSGEPDPCSVEEIAGEVSSACGYVIDAGRLPLCVPSTIVDLRPLETGEAAKIIRQGAMPAADIESRIDSCGCI